MTTCCSSDASKPGIPRVLSMNVTALPVAVIGGGPIGLAAAAQLLGRGIEFVVFEAREAVGSAPVAWGHVHMFSPWRYNVDKAARALLERHGWATPDPEGFPTGRELAENYLEALAALPEIASRLRLGTKVTGVARVGTGKVKNGGRERNPFEIRFIDSHGAERRLLARAVIVATGCWGNPGTAGTTGLPAMGERAAAARIRYGMPDVLGAERARYAGRRVLVVGSGHSAIGTLIDLAALADRAPETTVTWAARGADLTRAYGGGTADRLPERGALGERLRGLVDRGALRLLAPFAVDEVGQAPDGSLLIRNTEGREVTADEMVVATGLRPDLGILGEVRLDLDPALECPRPLAPLIDPNLHSCGTVRPHGAIELEQPDAGLFMAGMVSYGRAPTFLLATGYEQVRSIAAFLAGDMVAARRVELDLPQTGVCSARGRPEIAVAACCDTGTAQGECCPPKAELPPEASCCGPAARVDPAVPEPVA